MDANEAVDYLWCEVCRHKFGAVELRVLFTILRRARLFRIRIDGSDVEVFEARFPNRMFDVWTGIRSDHITGENGALKILSEKRVIVPNVWRDGVYQICGDSKTWRVGLLGANRKTRKPRADAHEANAIADQLHYTADRREDLVPEAGDLLCSIVEANNLAGAADVAKPTGNGVPARPVGADVPKGSISHLVKQMREAVTNGVFPENGSSFPENGSESPGIREDHPQIRDEVSRNPGNCPGIRESKQAADVASACKSVPLPESGNPIRNVTNDSTNRTDVTFKDLKPEIAELIHELPEAAQKAIRKLHRFLGANEINRYGARYWIPIAEEHPKGLLEHALWLLSLPPNKDYTKGRGNYAWSTWKAKASMAPATV